MNADPPLTKDIPVEQIKVFIHRAREKDGFEGVKASIKEIGVKIPVQVRDLGRKDADGFRYELICGEGRTAACRELGLKTIPAMIIEAKPEEYAGRFMAENAVRKGIPWGQKGRMIRHLMQAGMSMKEVCEGLHISEAHAQKYLRILDKKASDDIEEMPVNDAEVLTTLPAKDQLLVMEVVKETGQSVKAITQIAKKVRAKAGDGWTKVALQQELRKDDDTLKKQRAQLELNRLHYALGPINIKTLMRFSAWRKAAESQKLNLAHFE